MLAAILWSVAGLLAAALAGLIWLPIRVEGRLARTEEIEARLTVGLFAGLLPVRIGGGRARDGRRPAAKPRRRGRRGRRVFRRGGAILRAAPDLVAGLLRAIRVERLRVEGEFGLPDPAETGRLFGLLCPLLYAAPPSPRREIALRPVFDRAALAGVAEGLVAITLAPALGAVLRFGWRVLWNR